MYKLNICFQDKRSVEIPSPLHYFIPKAELQLAMASKLVAFVTLAVIAQRAASVAVWGQCTRFLTMKHISDIVLLKAVESATVETYIPSSSTYITIF